MVYNEMVGVKVMAVMVVLWIRDMRIPTVYPLQ
jgi:hypothetical protein